MEDHAMARAQTWPLIQEKVPKVPGTCELVFVVGGFFFVGIEPGARLKLGAHSLGRLCGNTAQPSPAQPKSTILWSGDCW